MKHHGPGGKGHMGGHKAGGMHETTAAMGMNRKVASSSREVNHQVHHTCGNDMGPLERVSREDLPMQGRGSMPRNK